jgi:hypothetical protein
MDKIFGSILDQAAYETARVDLKTFLICTGVAILLGIIIALSYAFKNNNCSRNFIISIATLPVVVEVVILLVNSLTTGIAIAGLFNLVRYRSIPGNSREITNVFMATVAGVTVGTGYIAYAALFSVIVVITNIIVSCTAIGKSSDRVKTLRITVPESLDFEGIFDDIFEKYTTMHEVDRIKTTNMGSMYQISYTVKLKAGVSEKEMIDEIRVRNGNLDIISSRPEQSAAML